MCQDFKHFGFAVSVIILNEDGTKIVCLRFSRFDDYLPDMVGWALQKVSHDPPSGLFLASKERLSFVYRIIICTFASNTLSLWLKIQITQLNKLMKGLINSWKSLKKSTEKEIQGEDVLTFCGATIILISILGGLVIWLVEDLDFWIALGAIFGVFSIGVFMCVVAKICRTLVEIRDNQLDK